MSFESFLSCFDFFFFFCTLPPAFFFAAPVFAGVALTNIYRALFNTHFDIQQHTSRQQREHLSFSLFAFPDECEDDSSPSERRSAPASSSLESSPSSFFGFSCAMPRMPPAKNANHQPKQRVPCLGLFFNNSVWIVISSVSRS